MQGTIRRPLSTVALRSAELVSGSSPSSMPRVVLRWADGAERTLHPLWLRDNCPHRRHPGTRQKLGTPADVPKAVQIAALDASDGSLTIRWHDYAQTSTFSSAWLRELGSVETSEGMSGSSDELLPPRELRVSFDELRDGSAATRWRWIEMLAEHGTTIVEAVPTTVTRSGDAVAGVGSVVPSPVRASEGEVVDGVRYVAELLGPMQPNIYGEIFNVISKGEKAENIAYTSLALGPHMDLPYYESPAGVQLLHCLRFDEQVLGGETYVIDAFAVAEAFRRAEPDAFEVLARVPATFIKDHSDRDYPVLMSYQRPHLAVEPLSRRLTGFFWSPEFEGPLRCESLTPTDVEAYYEAYRYMHAAIDRAPKLKFRLRPGEMLVFNNRRMLHGRDSFSLGEGGGRHLRGGYVNIDELSNRYNLLRRAMTGASSGAAVLGNQDWSRVGIGLPPRSTPRSTS
jgi:gamma-butyrobetaine dioxygenase